MIKQRGLIEKRLPLTSFLHEGIMKIIEYSEELCNSTTNFQRDHIDQVDEVLRNKPLLYKASLLAGNSKLRLITENKAYFLRSSYLTSVMDICIIYM